MRTRTRIVAGLVVVALGAAACSSTSSGSGTTSTARQGSGPTATSAPGSTATPSTSVPATSPVATAMTEALTAEHEAETTYANMVAALGSVVPFTTVRDAEAQHVVTLEALASRYGVTPPAGPFTGQASPTTRTAACQLGVTVETNLVALYDKLVPQVSGYADLTTAFGNLRTAEATNHLPAFQHCA